jgi:hypothetical protein
MGAHAILLSAKCERSPTYKALIVGSPTDFIFRFMCYSSPAMLYLIPCRTCSKEKPYTAFPAEYLPNGERDLFKVGGPSYSCRLCRGKDTAQLAAGIFWVTGLVGSFFIGKKSVHVGALGLVAILAAYVGLCWYISKLIIYLWEGGPRRQRQDLPPPQPRRSPHESLTQIDESDSR